MLLNIIIPTRNPRNYIERLLDSIVIQGWSKEDLEVIVADDFSDDGFEELLCKYEDSLSIKLQTIGEHKTHCPSNTRMDGLSMATADWVTFIDHDDMFEPEALNKFKEVIEKTNCQDAICFNFRQYDIEQNKYLSEYIRTNTWLHGKFYNLKFLKDNDIQFQEDLESNEDLYFNARVIGTLVGKYHKEYTYSDDYVYRWVNNPNSHSRKFFHEKYFYTDVFYDSYMDASIAPYISMMKEYPLESQYYLNQIMMNLLHSYFYLQAGIYRVGHDDKMNENTNHLINYVKKIHKELNMPYQSMIQYIYKYPDRYHKIKGDCFSSCGMFIESYSFMDFINYVTKSEQTTN